MLPSYLTDADLDALIHRALREDVGPGDVTTLATVDAETTATARLLAKADGVLAGLYVARRVFLLLDPSLEVTWHLKDGDAVTADTEVGRIAGRARSILTAERLALNLLQRMSGVATATARLVSAVRPHPTKILDTRKTAPGLRALDKWAVRLGGGTNHRIGLYDQILIKDNHIAAAGGIAAAIDAAQAYRAEHAVDLPVEIETRTLDEVRAVLDAGGVDIVLLDNMVVRTPDGAIDTSMLEDAVRLIDGRFATEASGMITEATAGAVAATGVGALSSGALTHSVQALDLSLVIVLDA